MPTTTHPPHERHPSARIPRRRPLSAGHVIVVMLVCALVGGLLNAAGIRKTANGQPVGNAITATLSPADWVQFSRVLNVAGVPASTTRAYAVVTRLSGDDTFYAYGVVNDNVTSDGSFVGMIPADRD